MGDLCFGLLAAVVWWMAMCDMCGLPFLWPVKK